MTTHTVSPAVAAAAASTRTELETRAEGHYAGRVKLDEGGDQIRTAEDVSRLLLDAFRVGDSSVRANAAFALLAWSSHDELVAACDHAEAVMSIVMPRSNTAEYIETLQQIRAALAKARGAL